MLSIVIRVVGIVVSIGSTAVTGVFLIFALLFADSPNENWPLLWAFLALLALNFGSVALSFFTWHYRKVRTPVGIAIFATAACAAWAQFILWPKTPLVNVRNVLLDCAPLGLLIVWARIRSTDNDLPNQSSDPTLSSGTSAAVQPPRLP
jgi:hypothetical protein